MLNAHLKHNMTQIVCIAIERLQQLQRFTIQQKYLIAFGENQFERNFGEGIAKYWQFIWICSLIDNCNKWKCNNKNVMIIRSADGRSVVSTYNFLDSLQCPI